MQCERLTMAVDPTALAQELRALVPAPESVQADVAEIIARVRAGGDDALRYYTRQFDTEGSQPASLRVPDAELDTATERLDPAVRAGLERAAENVRRVALASVRTDQEVQFDGHEILLRAVPVQRAGVYVPCGRAPYPSTVVMGAVTAQVAGVAEIAVCAPPGRDGEVDPVVLGACRLAGASVVYRMGGAQAIAAFAYGTETVTAVDVIVGPGNLYVQEAKRQVFGQVGIDGFAGPSDLMLIADADAEPELLALDLLAQAEHGPGTLVIGISDSSELLDELSAWMEPARETGAVARLVQVAEIEHALALAEAFAPEHLELVGSEPESLAPRITHAGCLFVGSASATAFGDYIAGSNHILPTNGAARFGSALSPAQFRRTFTEVRIGAAAGDLARAAAPVARAEGFALHARSMEARISDNGSDEPSR
jgi:histidinol dehydrogenase